MIEKECGCKAFTFVVMLYNQEEYVRLHLESIKYIIEHFGKDVECDLVISDDRSSDNTLEISQKWLKKNAALFRNVTINQNEHNLGIVSHYVKCLDFVKTEWFKILAGDDLYYHNDVFQVIQADYNMLVTPAIGFGGGEVELLHKALFYELTLQPDCKARKRLLSRMLKHSYSPFASSVFFGKSLVDERLKEEILKYKWIEDIPLLNSLYSRNDLRIGVLEVPLTLYRRGVGISLNKKHNRASEFENEVIKINKEICTYVNNKWMTLLLLIEKAFYRLRMGSNSTDRYLGVSDGKHDVIEHIRILSLDNCEE